jgi:hypothetical protein
LRERGVPTHVGDQEREDACARARPAHSRPIMESRGSAVER